MPELQSDLPIYLFAYGSCMNQQSLTATLGCDSRNLFIGTVTLHHHRLCFNYISLNEPVCCANIIPVLGDCVQGALYRLSPALMEKVDLREGVHLQRYKRQWVRVSLADGQQAIAVTYFACVTQAQEAAPSERYRQLIIEGARDAGVTFAYQADLLCHLEKLPARVMTNSSLY